MAKKNSLKLLKKYEVTLSVECYLNIYAQTALQDIQALLDVWEQVHQEECKIQIKSHRVVTIKQA
jgi:hypothetical protein